MTKEEIAELMAGVKIVSVFPGPDYTPEKAAPQIYAVVKEVKRRRLFETSRSERLFFLGCSFLRRAKRLLIGIGHRLEKRMSEKTGL